MNTIELIHEASSLPVDERARIVDSLLQTLNPVDDENAAKWVDVAHRRLEEIDSGRVQAILAIKYSPDCVRGWPTSERSVPSGSGAGINRPGKGVRLVR